MTHEQLEEAGYEWPGYPFETASKTFPLNYTLTYCFLNSQWVLGFLPEQHWSTDIRFYAESIAEAEDLALRIFKAVNKVRQ